MAKEVSIFRRGGAIHKGELYCALGNEFRRTPAAKQR